MRTSINTKYDYADTQNTARTLKAIRLQRGISRIEAAKKIGWNVRSLEALENARCNFSGARLRKILEAYNISEEEFERAKRQPKLAIAETFDIGRRDRTVGRRPRRNHLKIITKEVLVLRTLRKRCGLSQYAASKLCGFAPSMFGHIEEGRIEMRSDRIAHILKSLGLPESDFLQLMQSPILRDDLINEASLLLNRLDDFALSSALQVLKVLAKSGAANA